MSKTLSVTLGKLRCRRTSMLDGKTDEIYVCVYGSYAGERDGKTVERSRLLGLFGIQKMSKDDVWDIDETVTMTLPVFAQTAAFAVQVFEHDRKGKLYRRLKEAVGEDVAPVEDERVFRLPGGTLPNDKTSWAKLAFGVLSRLIAQVRNDDELGTVSGEVDLGGDLFENDEFHFGKQAASYYLSAEAKAAPGAVG